MCQTISIINQKQGTGKTTAAANIAATLALFEKKTLLIDCDPQSHLTRYAGIAPPKTVDTLYHGFMGQASARQLLVKTPIDCLSFIPSNPNLFLTEHRLAVKPGKELILKKIIQEVKNDFQYVIIDSPSSLGFFTVCAMAASDWSILPFACHVSSPEELFDLEEIIKMVQDQLNPDLKIAGKFFNQCTGMDEPDRFLSEHEQKNVPYKAFKTTIPLDETVKKSSISGKPVALYDITAKAAEAYFELSVELLKEIA